MEFILSMECYEMKQYLENMKNQLGGSFLMKMTSLVKLNSLIGEHEE
jgi:hypothetical protein